MAFEWSRCWVAIFKAVIGSFLVSLLLVGNSVRAQAPLVDNQEVKDHSAEPQGFRLSDYRAPVPKTLAGAQLVDTSQVEALLAKNQSSAPLLLDVLPTPKKPDGWPSTQLWLPEPHQTLPGAYWLPDIGFGTINEAVERRYHEFLREQTQGNLDHGIIVFCRENCWISWNAAKRLVGYGYRQVYWYSQGLDGWLNHLNNTEVVEPWVW